MRSVAHHQTPAAVVTLADEPGDVVVDLCLQGLGQHPAGALADQLVNQGRTTAVPAGFFSVGGSRNYGEHGSYPSDRRWRADLA